MSFSNPKQYNHPKHSIPSDKPYKGKKHTHTESTEDPAIVSKKLAPKQSETNYHRNSAQDNLENSQSKFDLFHEWLIH